MLRTIDFIIIGVMAAAAVLTFHVKYRAEEQLAEIKRLEAQIRLEEDTIDLLRADWSLLVQPGRLQELVDAHQEELGLGITEPHQMVLPEELPARVRDLPEPDEEMVVDVPDAETVTGSVAQ
ncbi:cell division protein FtsL [Hoeflea sp.]|uniref:cell division protein FtsL n=1 Tax=Hoeflea sp. TaxID=1940281 RepID=UPI003B02C436